MIINYDSISHHYYDDDGDYTSVTQLVGRFMPTFDSLKVSKEYALAHGNTAEYWLEYWAEISKTSQILGKKIHADLEEDVLCGLFISENYDNDFTDAGFGLREAFYGKYGKSFAVNSYETETIIFSKQYRVAGTFDLLLNCEINGEEKTVLIDYKTGKNIDLFGFDNDIASPPFFFIPASKYGKSAMQMGFYSDILLEKDIKVDICLIAHVTDEVSTGGYANVKLVEVTEMSKVCKIKEAKKYGDRINK